MSISGIFNRAFNPIRRVFRSVADKVCRIFGCDRPEMSPVATGRYNSYGVYG